MEEICWPDYNDSILNFSCSILKHYGIATSYETISSVDEILGRNYKHVVVILLDGLGMNVLEQHLNVQDFLRRNLLKDYSSVFPPTTTASTTSFLSSKSPIEHGWLGWDVYFEKEDKTVTCFTNKLQGTEEEAADYNVVNKYFAYENIVDRINKKGSAKANLVATFGPNPYKNLKDWIKAIKKSCATNEKTFTYAYWNQPDSLMHKEGINSSSVHKMIVDLNAKLLMLCENLDNTVVFITADHGHKNIHNVFLKEDYPDLVKMLKRPVSIEPRAISFYVKDEYKEAFPLEFNKFFKDDYILMSKKEVFEKGLFGISFKHENLTGIGDYLAVAASEKTILWSKKQGPIFKSHHAGLTKEEMRIPLIWYETKKKHHELFIYYFLVAMAIICLIIGII